MIWHLVVLLGFQLAGEAIVRALGLVIPGPVLGLAMLLGRLELMTVLVLFTAAFWRD